LLQEEKLCVTKSEEQAKDEQKLPDNSLPEIAAEVAVRHTTFR
jgi:hypothetical protein